MTEPESLKHDAKRREPDSKGYTLYDSIYMKIKRHKCSDGKQISDGQDLEWEEVIDFIAVSRRELFG